MSLTPKKVLVKKDSWEKYKIQSNIHCCYGHPSFKWHNLIHPVSTLPQQKGWTVHTPTHQELQCVPEVRLSEYLPQRNVDFCGNQDATISMIIFTKRDGF